MAPQMIELESGAPDPGVSDTIERLEVHAKGKDTIESAPVVCSEAKARDICRQVDFYFSSENLERDGFLKKQMKGSKNKPVLLNIIASFTKMRPFHPIEHIADALQQSESVNVLVENGVTYLQRKEAFHQKPKTPSAAVVTPTKKAKAASGFEQYYADAPMTPEDHREEEELYRLDVHIAVRLETAVRRYRSRRKFNSFASNVFQKWMAFGGVLVGNAAFQSGPDAAELEQMTATQKKEAKTPVHACGTDTDNCGEPLWDVDFVTLAKAFLSRRLPEVIELDTEERVNECVDIMQNFYRYLLYHNVCPEYEQDIHAARAICDVARKELSKVSTLQQHLPGPFNTAASTIFGGEYADLYAIDQEWARDLKSDKYSIGQSNKDAAARFVTGVVALGLDKYSATQPKATEVLKQEVLIVYKDVGMEIVGIAQPTSEMRTFYEALHSAAPPLGMLQCKPWNPPGFADHDLPPGLSASTAAKTAPKYTLVLEENLLAHCSVGMKLQATVRQLSSGMQFIDQIIEVACTFDTLIDNQLLLGHKEVQYYTREEMREREGEREGERDSSEDDAADLESD